MVHSQLIGIQSEENKLLVYCIYASLLSSQRNITLSLISPSHTINYKHQLDNVIFTNATYSFRMGEGTNIHYDFKSIEDEIIQRFIFSKPTISFEEFDAEFPGQMRMIDYFNLLKSKVQQVNDLFIN